MIIDRDDDATTGGLVPSPRQVDAGDRAGIAPLAAVAGIVGREADAGQRVDLDVVDVRVAGQLLHQLLGGGAVELAIGLDDVGAYRHAS